MSASLLLFLAAVAFAQEGHSESGPRGAPDVPAGDAVVVGRLVHETRPGAVANTDVLLYALSADGGAGLRQGRTDAEGRFRFEGISNAPHVTYLVGARPGEIPFGTRFTFKPGQREHRVELALSDPTADASRAAAVDLAIRVERGCTHLRVGHEHEIANRGDRVVFIPPTERATAAPIFEVELPAESDGFEAIAGGEGLVREGRRVRFFGPVYPGEQTVEFGYGLPLATPSFAIGFPSGAPATTVLSPVDLVAVSSDALRPAPERTIDEQRYVALRGAPIGAGGSLVLAVAAAALELTPVRTPRAELWLELDDAALEVDERIEVAAVGDGAPLVSSGAPLLCIPLPADATELRFSTETFAAGLRRDPSGDLAIHGPLPLGTSQLALSYRLPAASGGAALVKSFDRALPLLSVLVADNGVIADTARLHRRKSARVGDRNYLHLEAFAVEPGEVIELGLARTAPVAPGRRAAPAGFALLAGLAAFGFLLGPLRHSAGPQVARSEPQASEVHKGGRDPRDDDSFERMAIVRSLEALDEDLETGKLSAEDHAAMRASLRARAAEQLLARPHAAAEKPAQRAPQFCTACGAAARPTDAFCSQCGSKLTPPA